MNRPFGLRMLNGNDNCEKVKTNLCYWNVTWMKTRFMTNESERKPYFKAFKTLKLSNFVFFYSNLSLGRLPQGKAVYDVSL